MSDRQQPRPFPKPAEYIGRSYCRELIALRRAGYGKLAARYLLASVLVDRAGSIIIEANARAVVGGHWDGVPEAEAVRKNAELRDQLHLLVMYHELPHAQRIVRRAIE